MSHPFNYTGREFWGDGPPGCNVSKFNRRMDQKAINEQLAEHDPYFRCSKRSGDKKACRKCGKTENEHGHWWFPLYDNTGKISAYKGHYCKECIDKILPKKEE